jgi:hypothetical protein
MALAAAVLCLAMAGAAAAAEYEGSGDTGWNWDNQRDCCDDAVSLAQNDSAVRCRDSGGAPRINPGSARGMCDWDAQGDLDNQVYRCRATANVACW